MRGVRWLCLALVIVASFGQTRPMEDDTVVSYSPQYLLDTPTANIAGWKELNLQSLTAKDDHVAVMRQVQKLVNLKKITFYDCDLRGVSEKDSVPANVETVVISEGQISQSTIRWLAKFPAGVYVVFGCDVQHLQFGLGHFRVVTFDYCKVSSSALPPLIGKIHKVMFNEVKLIDDRK